jgi:hypothetical protein
MTDTKHNNPKGKTTTQQSRNIHPLLDAMQSTHHETIDMTVLQNKMKELVAEAKREEKQEQKEKAKIKRQLQSKQTKSKTKNKTKNKPILHSMTRRSLVKDALTKKTPTPEERLSVLQLTGTQICSRCYEHKNEKQFYRSKSLATGIRRRCIDCHYDIFNKKPRDNFLRQMYIDSKTRSSKKNFDFNIELKDLHDLFDNQHEKCALSGVQMTFIRKRGQREFTRNPTNVSLDRIDPKRGYTKDNIQLTTSLANHAKMDSTEDVFIQMCRDVANNKKMTNLL